MKIKANKTMMGVLAPLSHGKLTELVVSRIKNLVFSSGIEVGQKLPSERELALQFRISRSVVREALASLEQSGLIEIRRGRAAGAYIVDHLHKPLQRSTVDLLESGKIDVEQFLEARKAVECFGWRKPTDTITEEDLQRLEAINRKILENPSDELASAEANSLFHLTLSELLGNPLITMMLHSLLGLMSEMRFRHPRLLAFHKAVYRSHSDIITAVRQKDWRRCELLLAANIDQSRELKARKKSKGPRSKSS